MAIVAAVLAGIAGGFAGALLVLRLVRREDRPADVRPQLSPAAGPPDWSTEDADVVALSDAELADIEQEDDALAEEPEPIDRRPYGVEA